MKLYWASDSQILGVELPDDHAYLPTLAVGALEYETAGSRIEQINYADGWYRTEASAERKPIPPLWKSVEHDAVEVRSVQGVVARYIGRPELLE